MPSITIKQKNTDVTITSDEYCDLMRTVAELNIKFNFETVSDLISLAYRDSKVLGNDSEDGLFLEMEGKYVAKFFVNSYLVITKLINRRYKLEIKHFDPEKYRYNPCSILNTVLEEI
jgi:hypothetical protein